MLLISIIILVYLFLIKPGSQTRKAQMKPFEEVYITHRGFYDNRSIPENSLPAFRKTVRNNMGTELDVQLTRDGRLVVFHDHSLERMCGVDKVLTECTYDELLQYPLLNTEEKIPLFEEVLAVLKPDTPLIIEIKPEGDAIRTCEETVQLMKNYDYTYIMESFNPLVVKYLREKHPEIIRGQLAYNMVGDENNKYPFIIKFACTNMLTNVVTRPDFIAYHVHSPFNLSFVLCSKLFRAECVAWTVQSEKDLAYARRYYQQVIFDSFIPSDVTPRD